MHFTMIFQIILLFSSSNPVFSPFTEEAATRGINYLLDQDWDVVPFGDGIGFADLDGDQAPDIVAIGRSDGYVALYRNDGSGQFQDLGSTSGIPLLPQASGVIAADYDRDGDLDLYISRWELADVLLRNEGNFQFSDVTLAAGINSPGRGVGCAWGDFDGDGWLDLYVSNRDASNLLYRNLGDGTFSNVASGMGVDLPLQPTFQAVFTDYDQDGDADLYVANDRGALNCPNNYNFLFENQAGQFLDVTQNANAAGCVDSMCIAVGDFSANGFVDFYVTSQVLGNAFLENQGDGTFLEKGPAAGVSSFAVGWGSVLFDFDNDRYLDLFVCNMAEPNRLYHHQGSWPCNDLAATLALDDGGQSFTVAYADVEGDGDLDLLVNNRGESVKLYINHEGSKRSWARFDVLGTGTDRWAVGATVKAFSLDRVFPLEVIAGSNYKSQNELVLHLGLGQETLVDRLEIHWPDGSRRSILNLPANQRWTLIPPDRLGDSDRNQQVDLADFQAFLDCADRGFQVNCEVFDFDGDSQLTTADLDGFIAAFDLPLADCNQNNLADLREIYANPGLDANRDGVPDLCECRADLDKNGVVDQDDLGIVFQSWGDPGPGDFNLSGLVEIRDMVFIVTQTGCLISP